ncbi:MAG: hypothetical protein AABZ36_09315 [Nitrospirota bacterium]
MKKIMFLLSLTVLLMMGCTHELRITNEESFIPSQTKPSKAVKIGFLPSEDRMINAVIEEISLSSWVKEAKKGYQKGSEIEVDYISDLSTNMKFRASGQNFFITFPGFIVFTHAWLGYKYYVDIDTQSKLLDSSGKSLSEASIFTPYEIRYTSFARGATSSLIGWLTPGYGVLDVIPGIIFASSYDKRATPEFIEKAKPSYKAFVSSKVLEQIAAVQRTNSSGLKHLFEMDPVVIDDEINEDVLNSANDRHFVIYVMKIEDGQLIMVKNQIKEVTEETWRVLDKIAKKEMIPDTNNINHILFSFGISDMPFPKDMENASIYTMQNDKIVTLFKGSGAALRIAKKIEW